VSGKKKRGRGKPLKALRGENELFFTTRKETKTICGGQAWRMGKKGEKKRRPTLRRKKEGRSSSKVKRVGKGQSNLAGRKKETPGETKEGVGKKRHLLKTSIVVEIKRPSGCEYYPIQNLRGRGDCF